MLEWRVAQEYNPDMGGFCCRDWWPTKAGSESL